MAGARWLGKGDKHAADSAAVDAMRHCLMGVEFSGRVVIGEGEKDDAPMLHNGEEVGTGVKPRADIAVDPLDGTSLVAGRGSRRLTHSDAQTLLCELVLTRRASYVSPTCVRHGS